jgi:hypothetical protein
VIAGLAAVDDDRVVVGSAFQGHLEFIHCPVVAGDRGHGKAMARCQFHGQLAEPRSVEVFVIILVAGEIFHRAPDLGGRSAERLPVHGDHALLPATSA